MSRAYTSDDVTVTLNGVDLGPVTDFKIISPRPIAGPKGFRLTSGHVVEGNRHARRQAWALDRAANAKAAS